MKYNPSRVASTPLAGPDEALHQPVQIQINEIMLAGELTLIPDSKGIVLFAHGSGSSQHSPRNQLVAGVLQASGTSTLLFDLLTAAEEEADEHDGHLRFDINLLAQRLIAATRWLDQQPSTRRLGIGYFGASTGGAAALLAAAQLGWEIDAVVCRGARPDLAGRALPRVTAPTLLIVGGRDNIVRELNRDALDQLRCKKQIIVVPGATHLFEEQGALEEVAALSAGWFRQYLQPR
ncbi:MAG: dienelactone hydrolase family protein [Opitutus sp.]|nr:dienelactone hydrolase family protein [Opitutus sp.]MCS6248561.1 dienelactone hydrolase family protein [Opitutus sp.]MCS6275318.1 dienelactone hydrolase family protein [Opitutus sp.]MCS6277499.1 dienelactone hydrolase family protein [Opitutus sp.]MCS6300617.1 dienelactone hydrolase family protein [Opitutus sp.]